MKKTGIERHHDVSIKGLRNEMLFGLTITAQVFANFDLRAVIVAGTEGNDGDGIHKDGSLFYQGCALAFQKRKVAEAYHEIFLEQLESQLGRGFRVVDKNTCYEVEYHGEEA